MHHAALLTHPASRPHYFISLCKLRLKRYQGHSHYDAGRDGDYNLRKSTRNSRDFLRTRGYSGPGVAASLLLLQVRYPRDIFAWKQAEMHHSWHKSTTKSSRQSITEVPIMTAAQEIFDFPADKGFGSVDADPALRLPQSILTHHGQ